MRVVSLYAENFKRLKAVEITPDGNTVVISGKNAQGKSSVLDAIWAALAGKDGAVKRPVRDGQRKARVRLDLGDVVVERKWSGERTSLEVTAASGAKFPSPQKMLDDLIGSLSFDPLAFATQDGKRQRQTLIDLVPEDAAELERLADERKQAYDARTLANRDVKRLTAVYEELPDVPDGTPDEEVDVVALAGEVQAASQALQRRETLLAEHALNKREIERLQARQAEIVEEGKGLKWATDDHVATLTTRLSETDAVNQAVRVKRKAAEAYEDLRLAQVESTKLSDKITLADEKRDEIIAGLKLPVPGLSFDEEGVLYNGVPFVQASAAERLRVSVAMAMALNPEIRVIRITDGSLLDSDNMALIERMAADNDYQCWIERVSDGEGVGVVIEDGSVREG